MTNYVTQDLIDVAQANDKKARAYRSNKSPFKDILYEYSNPRAVAFAARKLARQKKNG